MTLEEIDQKIDEIDDRIVNAEINHKIANRQYLDQRWEAQQAWENAGARDDERDNF